MTVWYSSIPRGTSDGIDVWTVISVSGAGTRLLSSDFGRALRTLLRSGAAPLPEADVLIDGAQTPAVMMRELLERVSLG